jgi:hypothetical protein
VLSGMEAAVLAPLVNRFSIICKRVSEKTSSRQLGE